VDEDRDPVGLVAAVPEVHPERERRVAALDPVAPHAVDRTQGERPARVVGQRGPVRRRRQCERPAAAARDRSQAGSHRRVHQR
jgi:hypothetical protein